MADRAVGLPIVREGFPFVLATGGPAIVAGFFGWMGTALALGVVAGLTASFFRNPHRVSPPGDFLVLSPADGRVISIHEEFESRYLKEQSIRVSIFLNIFDVHVTRMPCAGTIADIAYQPGQFLPANKPEAAIRNEQNAVMVETFSQCKVLCVQVAGLIARRIVCWSSPGETVSSGERFGVIRFGSRVDTYLPLGTTIRVQVGSTVKGGETILAELP
jgi:phosphatidylserine decarboxylase